MEYINEKNMLRLSSSNCLNALKDLYSTLFRHYNRLYSGISNLNISNDIANTKVRETLNRFYQNSEINVYDKINVYSYLINKLLEDLKGKYDSQFTQSAYTEFLNRYNQIKNSPSFLVIALNDYFLHLCFSKFITPTDELNIVKSKKYQRFEDFNLDFRHILLNRLDRQIPNENDEWRRLETLEKLITEVHFNMNYQPSDSYNNLINRIISFRKALYNIEPSKNEVSPTLSKNDSLNMAIRKINEYLDNNPYSNVVYEQTTLPNRVDNKYIDVARLNPKKGNKTTPFLFAGGLFCFTPIDFFKVGEVYYEKEAFQQKKAVKIKKSYFKIFYVQKYKLEIKGISKEFCFYIKSEKKSEILNISTEPKYIVSILTCLKEHLGDYLISSNNGLYLDVFNTDFMHYFCCYSYDQELDALIEKTNPLNKQNQINNSSR